MRVCANCYTDYDANTTFCPHCGADSSRSAEIVRGLYPIILYLAAFALFCFGIVAEFLTAVWIDAWLANVPRPTREEFGLSEGAAVAYAIEFVILLAGSYCVWRFRVLNRVPPAIRVLLVGFVVGYLGMLGVCQMFVAATLTGGS